MSLCFLFLLSFSVGGAGVASVYSPRPQLRCYAFLPPPGVRGADVTTHIYPVGARVYRYGRIMSPCHAQVLCFLAYGSVCPQG